MGIAFIIFVFFLLIAYFFLSRTASPVPYFPSNQKDMNAIVDYLKLRNNHTVIDMGAGDGAVIFAAADYAQRHSLNTRLIAAEINPTLLGILYLRRLLHPYRAHISIMYADMFHYPFSKIATTKTVTVFYYISPWLLQQAYGHITHELPKARIVSYFYPLPHKKPSKQTKGVHQLFVYSA
ncbi:MAG: hypothetical protein NUV52_04830 [Candidatus Roizmanbacteria bacterium]|nr:hypothetical protein [Candidatus Roizmanbacteria bacterium]